jgi:Fungal specific transcription factor domain
MKFEFHALDRMFPKSRTRSYESDSGELASMATLLPAWNICDRLLEMYCLYFESIHPILHLPTLWSEYQLLRDGGMDDSGRERFVPQLLLIVTIASKMWKSELNSQTTLVIDPQKTCCLVEHWLFSLGTKERARLRTLQTYTLLVLAKRSVLTTPALFWQSTGELLRLALMSGFHRDPEELSGPQAAISVIELQGRRCLWYTIVELDIQASIACCMPSLIGAIDYTCQVPKQINDYSLTGEYDSERIEKFANISNTHITVQIALSRSLPLRIKVLNLLTRAHPSIEEIGEALEQLEEERSQLISHLAMRHSTEPETLFTTIMTDMYFRSPLISLYILQLQRLRDDGDARIHNTARALVNAAVGIMSHSDMLDPRLTDHESVTHDGYWVVFQAIHGDDLIRAAAGACFSSIILDSATLNTAAQPHPIRSERNCTIWPRNAVRRMVEEVMESMIRLTPDLRRILKQIMGIALTAELTRVHLDAESRDRHMKSALYKVFKICRERFGAENRNSVTGDNDLEQIESTTLPAFEELLNSQLLDVNPFGFDWDVDPLPNINF